MMKIFFVPGLVALIAGLCGLALDLRQAAGAIVIGGVLLLLAFLEKSRVEKPEMSPGIESGGRVIAVDANNQDRLLVRAPSMHALTGGLNCELPAQVQKVKRGLYQVTFGPPDRSRPNWRPAGGKVTPRRVRQPQDSALGYEHTYATVYQAEGDA